MEQVDGRLVSVRDRMEGAKSSDHDEMNWTRVLQEVSVARRQRGLF